jgi:hypothetical protein
MLSKFSKNIAGNYVQKKITIAALLGRQVRTPALQHSASLNELFQQEPSFNRNYEMRMFSTTADSTAETVAEEAKAETGFKAVSYLILYSST